jgi:hypothetical protein
MTSPTAQKTAAADTESGSTLLRPQRRNFVFVAIMLGMLDPGLDRRQAFPLAQLPGPTRPR